MQHADVTILKSSDGMYYPTGLKAVLNQDAQILGPAFLAVEEISKRTDNDVSIGDVVPKSHPARKVAVTKVYDQQKGTIYIAETATEFVTILQRCCGS